LTTLASSPGPSSRPRACHSEGMFALGFAADLAVATRPAIAQTAGTPQPSPVAALQPPRLLSATVVAYPDGASGGATVLLIVTVNTDGTVRSAVPTESHEPFSGVASAAARSWRYEPAMRGGKPVAALIRVAIEFHPPEPAPPATEPLPEAPAPSATPAATATASSQPPDEVQVHGAHEEPSRTATLSRAEIRQIPGAFGDPFRAIQIMPAVTLGQELTDGGDGQSTRDRLVTARTEIAYPVSPAALVRAGVDAESDTYDIVTNTFV